MVTLERTEDGRTRRATVTHDTIGWHYQETREGKIVREMTSRDWHRVERAMQVFEIIAAQPPHSTNR